MTALGAFTIDLYLPAFPVIEGELDVPTAVFQPLFGAPDPALFAEILPFATDALLNALTPWVAPETTINFAGDADLPEFTRGWPPATFERLEAIRGEVDPEGTFAYGPRRLEVGDRGFRGSVRCRLVNLGQSSCARRFRTSSAS